MIPCKDPRWRRSCQSSVKNRLACPGSRRGDGLCHTAGVIGTVLFDRIDIRVGAQIIQGFVGELSGVTVDEAELVGDIARGGANVGSERHPRLEGNDVSAGDGFFLL